MKELNFQDVKDSELYTVSPENEGKRLDAFVAEQTSLSRSLAVKLIEGGSIRVNSAACDKKYKLRVGDVVEIELPEPEATGILPEDIPLDIVYEDDDLIVINKPEGMVVHPAPGNYSGTLVNALMHHCGDSLSGIGGVIRPGIVHRIDKDTSGLLVVAKNDEAHISLSEQMKFHGVSRVYTAIVVGNIKEDAGRIDMPIGRHPTDRKKMAVIKRDDIKSREAVTNFRVLERFRGFCYLECRLETGRTHQIRVHLSSLGHPLMGDEVYGGGKTAFEKHNAPLIHGQCLHAGELSFLHPRTREQVTFFAPLPENTVSLLDKLRKMSL